MFGLLLLCATPATAQDAQRIVAIGDLHGDYEAYLTIVEAAGLSDDRASWLGGDTVLVQLGDVPDRGPDSLKIIRHLQKLEKAAAKGGGEVVVLVGNHEAMNITGDLRYVSGGEYESFADVGSTALRDRVFRRNREALITYYRTFDPGITEAAAKRKWFAENPLGKIEHRLAWSPKGDVGQWVIQHPAIVKIGSTLFVHGGISAETAARPIEAINDDVRTELGKGESDVPSILTDPLGPLWYRGNVEREAVPAPLTGAPPALPRPSIAQELTQVLAAYGAQRLVVAHTPHLSGIAASHNGQLIQIDTGISSQYGGVRSYLEIEGDDVMGYQEGADGKWAVRSLSPQGEATK